MKALLFARFAHLCSWFIRLLPKHEVVRLYSLSRNYFMPAYYKSKVTKKYTPDEKYQRVLWGLTFRGPLMNSAGMFKNGEGYRVTYEQGAAGYIGGTSTHNQREGTTIDDIYLPFLVLSKSQTTLNNLRLPNLGDKLLSEKIITKDKKSPIGWSLMRSPDSDEQVGLENLVKSLWLYHDNLQIDFLEINESCPNFKEGAENINRRLCFIGESFLAKRKRHLPVIVKLSPDISGETLRAILDILFRYQFDGVNLGNASTNYIGAKSHIVEHDLALFEYFTGNFGGGVGGNYLKKTSYQLCKEAVEYRDLVKPEYEFHVIRCGGIDSVADIYDSDSIGVSMNQWYSGYFSNYIKHGNFVYKEMLKGYHLKS